MNIILTLLILIISKSYADFTIHDDPISSETYEKMLIGPTIKLRKNRIKRYITLYNQEEKIESVDVPWVEKDCHDESDRFFNWSNEITISRTYQGSVGFEFLGFGLAGDFELSREITLDYERWIQAQKEMKARHYLKKSSTIKSGIILLQIKDLKNDKSWFSTSNNFPRPFLLYNQSPGLLVEREILEFCNHESID